jgi:hypothetical protein
MSSVSLSKPGETFVRREEKGPTVKVTLKWKKKQAVRVCARFILFGVQSSGGFMWILTFIYHKGVGQIAVKLLALRFTRRWVSRTWSFGMWRSVVRRSPTFQRNISQSKIPAEADVELMVSCLAYSWILKMEPICSSTTSGCLRTARRYKPEDVHFTVSHSRGNLKFNMRE